MTVDWGIIITLVSTFLSVVIGLWSVWYFYAIPKLRYRVEILPFVVPLSSSSRINNKLKILYNDKEVNELSFVRITIYNKGKGVATSFASPIKIKCSNQILEAYPNKEALDNKLFPEYIISKDKKTVEFRPEYINQNESLCFYTIVDGAKNIDVSVIGRCKGCTQIKKTFDLPWKQLTKRILDLLTFLMIVFIVMKLFMVKNRVHDIETSLSEVNQSLSEKVKELNNSTVSKSEE